MSTTIGDDGTSRILVGSTKRISFDGEERVERYRCAQGSVDTIIAGGPQMGSGHPNNSTITLQEISYDKSDGGFATLTYSYRPPSSASGGSGSEAREVLSARANAVEIPIEQNPNYSASWITSKVGVESYLDPQPIFVKKTRVSGFTWTEANISSNVGKRNAPLAGFTANNWLKTGRDIDIDGNGDASITETWQYAENGWDTDIYGT